MPDLPGLHPAAAPAVLDPDRLAALRGTRLLDSAPEPEFDRLTALTARVAAAPVSLVALIEADRSYFKSAVGVPEMPPDRVVPLSHSLCQHVVGQGAPVVIDDARTHPLVRDNGGVTDLGVGAYLGVPVRGPSGHVLGSLCAMDMVPRKWTDEDQTALQSLAASVESEIALRAELVVSEQAEGRARAEADALATIVGINAQLAAELDPDRLVQSVIDAGTRITGAAFGAFFYSKDPDDAEALLFVVSGAPRAAFEGFGAVRMTPLFEPTFSGREAVRCDDVTTDSRYGAMGGMPQGHFPVRSYLSVPVRDTAGVPLGALLFGHPEPGVFDERAERVAEGISDQAAIALQNAHLHRALNDSEQRLRMVLGNLNDVVFQTDRQGRYTYLNDTWYDKTGYAVADAVGRHCLAFAGGDLGALTAEILAKTQSADAEAPTPFQTRVPVQHADGAKLHFEAHWRPAFGDDGDHVGWAGTLTDVTDTVRYHAEREAREAAETARAEAERMTRLQSAFLANMSHEIRTPLTAILGFAEIIAEEVPDGLQAFADAILSGGQRLLDTLNSVLDLAQIEAGHLAPHPRPVDIARHLEGTVGTLRPLAEARGLALHFYAEALPDAVSLDAPLFDRVASNLISNAIKFTEHGHVAVRLTHDEDRLWLVVEDTGAGIPESAQAYLFDPFRQVSEGHARTHEGNGLGLAIVRNVTELLGGTVEVESQLGAGSRFTVGVPAPPADVPDECSAPELVA